ncbi:lipopolysaccharide biosynthesis protein [Latilactobacillus sakei]|uniref:lipopolysaccharide biosynthesis protein n=1 Tax=Latilactobacillus sakei TaxID=1599 RepID=UPI0024DFF2D9|nr:lipopolysaccharide biosynthesis protein [Latilactobacillus sakei]
MNKILSENKILLFCPSFFNYEKSIYNKLIELGATVDFFDERPSNSTFIKGLIRINKSLAANKIDSYYKKIYKEISNNSYDFILFFQAEATPEWFLKQLSLNFNETKRILYLWDSVADKPNSLKYHKYYDEIYTFDPKDAQAYKLKFRPLFYLDSYLNTEKQTTKKKYDYSFVGTIRDERYVLLEKLKIKAKEHEQNYFFYYYLQSKLVYFYFKFIKKDFSGAKIKQFSFTPLEHKKINEIFENSKVVVDIQKTNQVGLTIRTIELLAAGKKFITTNKEIEKYDFFNSNNIKVIERANPMIDDSFIKSMYEPVNIDILKNYSLDSFICEILDRKESEIEYKYGEE